MKTETGIPVCIYEDRLFFAGISLFANKPTVSDMQSLTEIIDKAYNMGRMQKRKETASILKELIGEG